MDRATHLGHELDVTGNQEIDCSIARAQYIGQSNEILNMFEFAEPIQILNATQIYCCAWYGSNLWNLYGKAAGKAFRSWSATIKMSHNLPRQCRTFIVDHYLSGSLPSVRQIILRRFIQFTQKLVTSENPVLRQLSNLAVATVQSTTGLNVSNIREEFKLDPLNDYKKLFCVDKSPLPPDGLEVIELLDFLLYIRNEEAGTEDTNDMDEIEAVIFNICTT